MLKTKKKRYAYWILCGAMSACSHLPEIDPRTEEMTDLTIGQDGGSIVLSWKDPVIDGIESVSVVTVSDSGASVDRGTVDPGAESYTVPKEKLVVGDTYFITLFTTDGKGRNSAEITVPHTVSELDLRFTKADVFDTWAGFEWKVSDETAVLFLDYTNAAASLEVGNGEAEVNDLMPGADYVFTLRDENGRGSAQAFRTAMLFYDDFSYADTEEVVGKRWFWANRENPNVGTMHWSYSMRGDGRNAECLNEDGVDFLRLKGTVSDKKDLIGSGIRSSDRFWFTFGKVEIRFRFAGSAAGSFPALWMMPQIPDPGAKNGGVWPFGGEIDIMERVYTSAWKIWQTYHTEETGELGGGNPDTYNVKGVRSGLGKKEDWTKWNTVGIEWSREGLQWSINGVRTKRVESESGNIRAYPFTEESAFFLIFNMSVVRNSGFAGTAADDFYNHLDIDYVKITPNADTVFRDCPYYRHSAEEGDVL